jgi:hypothetical protein
MNSQRGLTKLRRDRYAFTDGFTLALRQERYVAPTQPHQVGTEVPLRFELTTSPFAFAEE